MNKQYVFSQQNWKVIPLTVAEQREHIERSELLLADATPGTSPVLYWSQAMPEGLVLGFSQKEDILNLQALESASLPVYHRRAGGTAVLVGPHLLGLDVILPADHPLVLTDIVESYRWFGETWVQALNLLGVPTCLVTPDEAHTQRALARQEELKAREIILRRACYASNSSYEVVVGTRKLVGLDMLRRRHGTLLQAGILLSWKSETLALVLGHTPDEQRLLRELLPTRAVGLDELTAHAVTTREVIQAFETALFNR